MKCGMFEGCLMKRVKLWQWMSQVFRVRWSLRAGFSEQRTSMPWPGCLTQEMEVQASVAKNGEARGQWGQEASGTRWGQWSLAGMSESGGSHTSFQHILFTHSSSQCSENTTNAEHPSIVLCKAGRLLHENWRGWPVSIQNTLGGPRETFSQVLSSLLSSSMLLSFSP